MNKRVPVLPALLEQKAYKIIILQHYCLRATFTFSKSRTQRQWYMRTQSYYFFQSEFWNSKCWLLASPIFVRYSTQAEQNQAQQVKCTALVGYNRLHHKCANHDTEGKRFKSPIHCCDVTKPPYLFSGELCTCPLHCTLLFVYTVCCRHTGQCFSVLITRKSDVILT